MMFIITCRIRGLIENDNFGGNELFGVRRKHSVW